MVTYYAKNMLKQSATTHDREMSHINDTLQLNDTQTMKMMVCMVLNSYTLKT